MNKPKILLSILPLTWPNMPPIGLGYLQAFLAQQGMNADIIDYNHVLYTLSDHQLKKQWSVSCNTFLEKNILTIIKERHPGELQYAVEQMLSYDVVGFSCFKSNYETTLMISEILKTKKHDIKILLGGPEITRQFFKSNGKFHRRALQAADFLIAGEGEVPLTQYLNGNSMYGGIAKFEQLRDLEILPFPMYTGIDLHAYPKKNTLPLQFSRGCIRRCNFCSERLLYKNFRIRTVKSIIEEIRYHKTLNRIEYFVFYDSLINADLNKLEALCDSIIEHFGSIHWEAQIAVRKDMPRKLFDKMKKSGCYSLFIGLESASEEVLKKMNKGFTLENALDFFKVLHQNGLFFGISIIVGYPGETELDFRNSLDCIIRHRDIIPQIAQVNPFTYYDGTPADKEGDYTVNPAALKRMDIFVHEIKKHTFLHTNAFIGNLMKKNDGST
ncbi:MAG: radical SAM protein [Candidatus Brocadiaceae bacterium]|nr:radical SAM protein [Candidatus Brocadiaceae bacterium]